MHFQKGRAGEGLIGVDSSEDGGEKLKQLKKLRHFEVKRRRQ